MVSGTRGVEHGDGRSVHGKPPHSQMVIVNIAPVPAFQLFRAATSNYLPVALRLQVFST